MSVKVKLARKDTSLAWRFVRALLMLGLVVVAFGAIVFGLFYHQYAGMVEDRLQQGPLFASTAQIYAAPQEVRPGQQLTAATIAASLRRAGYNINPQLGSFQLRENSILVKPGPQSYLATDGATIDTAGGSVQSITAENGAPLAAYKLEPQLITALSEDKNRAKRLIVTYNQIPPQMVQAVLAIEDRRFFDHHGINWGRTAQCVVHDIINMRKDCGGSTITQQLAKNFFLTPDKKISRKIAEMMITFQLENRFSKQEIFTMYANEINIGQRGSFGVNGFGEAAQAYFGKDLRQLNLEECAMIAGLIQNPNRRNPYRHPDRAIERRNVVLDSMVETGAITAEEAERAKAAPLHLAPPNIDASEAPYFVDLVHEQMMQRLGDTDVSHASLRIYTSLDPDLQRAAADAVDEGMKHVDELVRRRYTHHKKGVVDDGAEGPVNYPQVALIALNPHTGQVLALIGGRNYGVSQLNHALAERPTGSIFKPFVYAAAYNTSLNGMALGDGNVFTALTQLNDDPQDFVFDGKDYQPGNFVKGESPGMVTAAEAIAKSLNIATINLAQQVGYENVAALARSAGITNARGTPSMAIGTYNATPIDMAGAYTVFANNGVHLKPWMLASVRNGNGDIVADFAPEAKQVMDPRTANLTQGLLEFVMTYGTASSVRSHGFMAPAAGKTGTDHDAWFAGYTSNLLCIIWVGNDDYTDISTGLTHRLQGADTAAPIWAAFMNRAIKLPQYSDMKALSMGDGVQTVRVDRESWLPADDSCPNDYYLSFLVGTVPGNTCSHMGSSTQNVIDGLAVNGTTPPNAMPTPGSPGSSDTGGPSQPKKKNLFEKIFGGGDKPAQPSAPPQ
jgi:penicillin-binding protein 1B